MSLGLVDIDLIQTPLEDCLSFAPGPISPDLVARMVTKGYDDAPVIEDGRVVGTVSCDSVTALLSNSVDLGQKHHQTTDRARWLVRTKGRSVPVTSLLECLRQERCTLVCDPPKSLLESSGRALGFMTISDLNRHSVRAALYEVLAGLEARLAILVERAYEDPWDWIRRLSEEHQVRILGFWDLSKRQGLDLGPVAAATLTHLLVAVAKSPELSMEVGFKSPKAFTDATGSLPGIRNAVMHPVRPLISKQADVESLLSAVKCALAMEQVLLASQTLA
jgi:hypothetical protein